MARNYFQRADLSFVSLPSFLLYCVLLGSRPHLTFDFALVVALRCVSFWFGLVRFGLAATQI